jgi:hypothetical protein
METQKKRFVVSTDRGGEGDKHPAQSHTREGRTRLWANEPDGHGHGPNDWTEERNTAQHPEQLGLQHGPQRLLAQLSGQMNGNR